MNDMSKINDPNIVNGLNVDDLKELIGKVAAEPEEGRTSWRVKTTWHGQTRSRSEVSGFQMGTDHIERNFSFDADEPNELGGENQFANPQEYLLGAVNACMTVGYVAQCSMRGITIDSLWIETEGDIDLRGFLGLDPDVANGYRSLRYKVHIKGDAPEHVFEEIHRAVQATSPNFFNMANAITMDPELVVE